MSERIRKINSLIQSDISEILMRELDLKSGVFITVAKVDTTSDLRYTRIFVSIYPTKETNYAMQTIKKELYHLQGALNKKLHMRPLPRMEFFLDTTEQEADDIEHVLKKLKKE